MKPSVDFCLAQKLLNVQRSFEDIRLETEHFWSAAMKLHMTKLPVTGFVAALALSVPGVGWAADHVLIIEETGGASVTTTPGVVSSPDGSVTTPVTVNARVTFGQSQAVTLKRIDNVKMCKPGTKNRLEWLDQGTATVGIEDSTLTSGTSTTPTNSYRLVLNTRVRGPAPVSGSCTSEGAVNYTVANTATIDHLNSDGAHTTRFNGTFTFGSKPGSAPEPNPLYLIGLGLAGMAWIRARRARKTGTDTV